MKFTKPALNQTFTVTSAPEWPGIGFETDATGAHTWHWSLVWGAFKKSGKEATPGNTWDAKTVVAEYRVRNTAGWPLLFVSDKPYSASFYSEGKAQRVAEFDELAKRLDQGGAFVALTKPQVTILPPELNARLKLEMQSGAFDLYSSAKK